MSRFPMLPITVVSMVLVLGLVGCPLGSQGDPEASFTASTRSGTAPLTVQFTDTSEAGSGTIQAWRWSFGDGATSTERDPIHTYLQPGDYTVGLTVVTAVGEDTEERAGYITVGASEETPTARFSATPTTGESPLTVRFFDESLSGGADIVRWEWDFDSNGTVDSNEQNPLYTYSRAGLYSVTLTVATSIGSDSSIKTNYISVHQADDSGDEDEDEEPQPANVVVPDLVGRSESAANQLIILAGLSVGTVNRVYSDNVRVGQVISQEPAAGTVVATESLVSFAVSLGPDPNATVPDVVGETESAARRLIQGARLTVGTVTRVHDEETPAGIVMSQNPAGGTTVNAGSAVNIVVSQGAAPLAAFRGRNVTLGTGDELGYVLGDTEHVIEFWSLSESDRIDLYEWDYGDGSQILKTNQDRTRHRYAARGTYDVTLRVYEIYSEAKSRYAGTYDRMAKAAFEYGDYVLLDSYRRPGYVVIESRGPTADFSISDQNPYRWETLTFTDRSEQGTAIITSWLWDFGDGTTTRAQNPTHIYTETGVYVVTLTVTTPLGEDTVTKQVNVTDVTFVPQFSQDRSWVISGLDTLTLTDESYVEGPHNDNRGTAWAIWQNQSLRPVPGTPEPPTSPDPTLQPWLFDSGKVRTLSPRDGLSYHLFYKGFYHISMGRAIGVMENPQNPWDPASASAFHESSLTKHNAVEVHWPSVLDHYIRDEASNEPLNYFRTGVRVGPQTQNYTMKLVSQAWKLYGNRTPELISDAPAPQLPGGDLPFAKNADQPDAHPDPWEHDIVVIVPNTVETDSIGLLYVTGGNTGDPIEVSPALEQFAEETGAIVAVVNAVPNQPLDLGTGSLSEYELIAESFAQFLESGDRFYPILFPMAKSIIRAMDAAEAFTAGQVLSGLWPPRPVEQWVLAGNGARAWGCYLAATADPRVQGIIPMGFDNLGLKDQIQRAQSRLGRLPQGWAAFEDILTDPEDSIRQATLIQQYIRLLESAGYEVLYDLWVEEDWTENIDYLRNLLCDPVDPETGNPLPADSDIWSVWHHVADDTLREWIFNDTFDIETVGLYHYMLNTSLYWRTEVPNVAGFPLEVAWAALDEVGLAIGEATFQYSDNVPLGNVISQEPAAGTEVNTYSPVDLVVSLGEAPGQVEVPNVVGDSQADAETKILAANLTVGDVTERYSPTVPAGNVISQEPAANDEADPESAVNLVISLGPIPNVVGDSQADAETKILDAGLTVGNVTEEHSETVPAGRVISQEPAANDEADPGSAVDLVISLGPTPEAPAEEEEGGGKAAIVSRTSGHRAAGLGHLSDVVGPFTDRGEPVQVTGIPSSEVDVAHVISVDGLDIVVSLGPIPPLERDYLATNETEFEVFVPEYVVGRPDDNPLFPYQAPGLFAPPDCALGRILIYLRVLKEMGYEGNLADWLYSLIDPLDYNERYDQYESYWSEFGGRLRMPKYLMMPAGDPDSLPESMGRYFGVLNSPKLIRYWPNTGSSFVRGISSLQQEDYGAILPEQYMIEGPEEALLSAVPWFQRIAVGELPPQFTWTRYGEGGVEVRHSGETAPEAVLLWQAYSPTPEFAFEPGDPDNVGPEWYATPLNPLEPGRYFVQVDKPEVHYLAFFVELVYDARIPSESYTTEMFVVNPRMPGAGALPMPRFTADRTEIFPGMAVNLTDQSYPGDASITSWAWDLGDGTTSTQQNIEDHIYMAQPDEAVTKYDVSLEVTSSFGSNKLTKAEYIEVHGANFAPSADTASPDEILVFMDQTPTQFGEVVSWAWDFGDGNTSIEQNPAHSYAAPGTYTVSLTVEVDVVETAADGTETIVTLTDTLQLDDLIVVE